MLFKGLPAKARALIDLVKPELPAAIGICVLVGQVIASRGLPPAHIVAFGFLTGFFISGAAMVSNDYFDVEVDRVNSPKRPLPSGCVTGSETVALACLLAAAGLATAMLLGSVALAFAAVLLAASILYNWRLKETGLPGHLIVAFCVASTFVLGGVTAGGLANGTIWIFGILAFLFDLGEEIANSAMDMEGDGKRSVRTLARAYGREFALRVATALFALVAALSYVPFLMGWLDRIYLAIFVPMSLAILYLAMKLLTSQTFEAGHAKTRQLYLMMTVFAVVFIAISLI